MNKIKKIVTKVSNKINEKVALLAGMFAFYHTNLMLNVYATSGTSSIDPFINFVCEWIIKIGGMVALVGGVMFALGWQREDAEGKSRGLLTLMAGFMLIAIGSAPSIFGL